MPHYLDHHHPFVRAGSRVQAVNGIRSNTYSRIKSEGEICSPDIIVDSLRHRHDVQSHGSQFGSSLLRTVTTDTNHTIQS